MSSAHFKWKHFILILSPYLSHSLSFPLPLSICFFFNLHNLLHCRWLFAEGTAAHGEPVLKQVYLEGLQPMRRSHTGVGGKCEEEEASERSCYGLSTVPHSPSLCAAQKRGGRGVRDERVKWSLERAGSGPFLLVCSLVLVCSCLFLINQVYFYWKWIKLIFLEPNLFCPWQ